MSEAEGQVGETWTYESLVGAVPGIGVSPARAVALQFAGFEAGVLALGWLYDLPAAAAAGTVAVGVAAGGSAAMLWLGERIRDLPAPAAYRRLLFGTSVEVALGLVAYAALLTYLFVHDPRDGASLVVDLLGTHPPLPAVFLALLILWDLCYRIGTGWWAAVAALYRSTRYAFEPAVAAAFRRLDLANAAFALLQLVLVLPVRDHPVLVAALVGHALAVWAVLAASLLAVSIRAS